MIRWAGYLNSSLLALGLALVFSSPPAAAFDYAEHYAITFESLRRACANIATHPRDVPDERHYVTATGVISVERLCSSPKAATCLAHMAAIAGDYAVKPEEFVDAIKLGLLDRDGTDCTALDGLLAPASAADDATVPDSVASAGLPDFAAHLKCIADSSTGAKHRDAVLIDSWIKRKWRWITLAASNASHFHPQSRHMWNDYSAPPAEDSSTQYVMARHAFSLHFLEDSFAAGHIGLNRGEQKFGEWGARHDYGHAYHDDLNASGQHLQNERGELWYAYGDKNLCTPTLYLDVAKWSAAGNPDLARIALKSIVIEASAATQTKADLSRISRRQDAFARELASAIDTLIREDVASEVMVASLPIESSVFALCSFFVNCNKLEIVVIDSTKAANRIEHVRECELLLEELPATAHAALYRCHDTKEHVLRAATAAQEQFLWRLARTGAGPATDTQASTLLPIGYVPIDVWQLSDARGANALNFDPLLLRSSFTFKHACEYVQLPHTAWGFDLSYAEAPRTGTPEWSIDFGPQARLQGEPITVRMALLTRHGNHTSVLDQFEAGYDFARITEPVYRVLSLAPSVHGGIDAIFRGSERRNVYAGGGVDLEMDIGRYVLQLGFARDIHWTHHDSPYWQSRLTFGLKIPSMDLTPPPRSAKNRNTNEPSANTVAACTP